MAMVRSLDADSVRALGHRADLVEPVEIEDWLIERDDDSRSIAIGAFDDGEAVGLLLAQYAGPTAEVRALSTALDGPAHIVTYSLLLRFADELAGLAVRDCDFRLRRADLVTRQMVEIVGAQVGATDHLASRESAHRWVAHLGQGALERLCSTRSTGHA